MSIAVSEIYGFITRAAQIKLSLNAFGWVLVYHCLYFLTPIKFGYFDIVLIYINIYMYSYAYSYAYYGILMLFIM